MVVSMNTNFSLVYPMFAMVCLTFMVGVFLLFTRIYAARSRAVNLKYFKLLNGDIPEFLQKPTRHFVNLFEVPILFYAACLTAMVTGTVSETVQTLAWVFVGFRVLQALIHIGPNSVYPRMLSFLGSFSVVIIMWVLIVLNLP
jgi:hypothetical protein